MLDKAQNGVYERGLLEVISLWDGSGVNLVVLILGVVLVIYSIKSIPPRIRLKMPGLHILAAVMGFVLVAWAIIRESL